MTLPDGRCAKLNLFKRLLSGFKRFTNMEATIINTKEGIELFNLQQLRYALKLELKGLRHSRGSAYATIKQRFGFKGNKANVLTQLESHIQTKEKEYGVRRVREQKKN